MSKHQLKARGQNQANYIRSISENTVTCCTGVAGTGKTALAVGLACEYLLDEKVEKIIISRPTVGVGYDNLGFMPGDMIEKMDPYLVPILDEMRKYFSKTDLRKLLYDDVIQVVPLFYMRGRSFHSAFVILDEAQNAEFAEIKMFLTRIGKKAKVVINGDIDQYDLKHNVPPLQIWTDEILVDMEDIAICKLEKCDIVRHKLVGQILDRCSDYESR